MRVMCKINLSQDFRKDRVINMVRKLLLNDDLDKVSKLIYKTDDFIFPFIFGKQEKAIPILKKLILLENNDFSHNYIYCMENDGIQGILIGYDPKEIDTKKENRDFLKSFSIGSLVRLVKKGSIIEPVLDKRDIPGLYIQNICVDEDYRGMGIGSSLIEYFFQYAQNNNYSSVFLDVGIKNESAKRLYEKKGFKEFNKKMVAYVNDGFYRMKKTL
jgi:ribosomal protein S18 acetylase RimI-like enzyme